ncbi:LOW QUALITY PROTEIN: hypothetical protein M8C21_020452 [Ambrosia artemisiifolia]|uniref:ATPase family AAA domain-containing protein n=1 Tax=Ambrosia artemisiifolia TaxID=4212 RepID=A0AAD5CBZ8_AMBAR|nr:LOW QUALITY PROTEIN: hypothetical protein M8C21_020452 [Ambrosia artemisiifolia]
MAATKRKKLSNKHKQEIKELIKMQEESSFRIERETIRIRAMAEAEGRAHEAKFAEDVNKRMLIERANAEREKWVSTINTTFEHIGGGLRAILTDQNKLVVAVGVVIALAAGICTAREGARWWFRWKLSQVLIRALIHRNQQGSHGISLASQSINKEGAHEEESVEEFEYDVEVEPVLKERTKSIKIEDTKAGSSSTKDKYYLIVNCEDEILIKFAGSLELLHDLILNISSQHRLLLRTTNSRQLTITPPRWHQLILLKNSDFVPHFIKIDTMFETLGTCYWLWKEHIMHSDYDDTSLEANRIPFFMNQPRMGVRTRKRYESAEYIPPRLLAGHGLQWRIHPSIVNSSYLLVFLCDILDGGSDCGVGCARVLHLVVTDDSYKLVVMEDSRGSEVADLIRNMGFWNDVEAITLIKVIRGMIRGFASTEWAVWVKVSVVEGQGQVQSRVHLKRVQKVIFIAAHSKLKNQDVGNDEEKETQLFSSEDDDMLNEIFVDGHLI